MNSIIKFRISITILMIFSVFVNAQNFNYDLKYHRLEITVNPEIHYISGAITTYFKPTAKNFDKISFDFSDEMQIDSIIFHQNHLNYKQNSDILTITLPNTIEQLDSITIFYQGEPPAIDGFGNFITASHNGTPIMWTLSEPYGAKTWFPCKQTLIDKADSIDLIVTTPIQYKVAGNGLIVSIDTINDSTKITHWKHKYPITAYLIAFAVTNYAEYYDYVNIGDTLTLPILEYVYPEDSAIARSQTPDIIDVLQFYCDSFMLYPFINEKYGQAQFGKGGGMEHQTMTFIGNFDHALMAHELAHQWFGDYITCGSWQEIWLNEGFAVYLEGLTAEQGLAPYSWDNWKKNTLEQATKLTEGSVFVEDTTSVRRIFNYQLTYMKGGFILHTLRWTIGDKAFFEGIRNYLNDSSLAYGYAHVSDIEKHFEDAADTDLTDFFDNWYYGQGYPVYSVFWSQNDENTISIKISQKTTHQSVSFYKMKIPIQFIGNNIDTTIVFDNIFNNQTFDAKVNFKVEKIIFDPEKWILCKNAVYKISNPNYLNISVLPNPATEKIKIIFPIKTFCESCEIFDDKGISINKTIINQQKEKITIKTDSLLSGIYFIQIKTENGTINKKFIKE